MSKITATAFCIANRAASMLSRSLWSINVLVSTDRFIRYRVAIGFTERTFGNIASEVSGAVHVPSIFVASCNICTGPPSASSSVFADAKLGGSFPNNLGEVAETTLVSMHVKIIPTHFIIPVNKSSQQTRASINHETELEKSYLSF